MSVRKRALKPDPQDRYRPYLGYRIDGMQQRFNLGMDKSEAEYAQMNHVERQRFRSLDIVPADPALYAAGLEM